MVHYCVHKIALLSLLRATNTTQLYGPFYYYLSSTLKCLGWCLLIRFYNLILYIILTFPRCSTHSANFIFLDFLALLLSGVWGWCEKKKKNPYKEKYLLYRETISPLISLKFQVLGWYLWSSSSKPSVSGHVRTLRSAMTALWCMFAPRWSHPHFGNFVHQFLDECFPSKRIGKGRFPSMAFKIARQIYHRPFSSGVMWRIKSIRRKLQIFDICDNAWQRRLQQWPKLRLWKRGARSISFRRVSSN
jgi:hypothetical protein